MEKCCSTSGSRNRAGPRGVTPLAGEPASGHHRGQLFLPTVSPWEPLGESGGSSQAYTSMFSQETITKNVTLPHYMPPACLQKCWHPVQESECFTAAWQLYDGAELWSDPELFGLHLASCKATQMPWTPRARAHRTAFD